MANNGVIAIAGDNTTKIRIPAGKSMEATTTASATYTKNLNATTPGYEVANILVRYADGTSGTTNSYNPQEKGKLVLTMDTGKKIYLDSTAAAQTVGTNPTGALYTSRISNVSASTTGPVDLELKIDDANPSSPLKINGATTPINITGLKSGTYQYGDVFNISGTITDIVATSPTDVKLTLGADNNITGVAGVTVTVPRPTSFTYSINDKYSGQMKISKIVANSGAVIATVDGNRAAVTAAVNVTSAVQNYPHTGSTADGKIVSVTRESTYEYAGRRVSSVVLNTKSGTSIDGLVGTNYAQNDTFYPSVTTTIAVYDSLGAKHDVPVVFTKASNNKWTLSLGSGGDSFSIHEADGTTTTIALTKTDLKFDTSGSYISGSAGLSLSYENGAAPQQVAINLAAITQYSGTSTIAADSDGNAAGTLSNVDIDSQGVITGTYTNGVRQKEAQIAMAQFNNPSGLTKLGGNLYQESNNTGTRTISGAADIGTELTTSALEMANVDLADQFSDMIITQRGFQSNSKMITVSDEMLETLINMKR